MSLKTELPPEAWKVVRDHEIAIRPPDEVWVVIAPDTGDSFRVAGGPFDGPGGVRRVVADYGWFEPPSRWWRFRKWVGGV